MLRMDIGLRCFTECVDFDKSLASGRICYYGRGVLFIVFPVFRVDFSQVLMNNSTLYSANIQKDERNGKPVLEILR